ncbi:MAG: TonB-dependent receptor [Muribaculaceae bacterium]|jgi:TonB-linked SusC/RagA family outer membrane protein|nr:TonB-dependent receptor [Muribaculaceae bacterium]
MTRNKFLQIALFLIALFCVGTVYGQNKVEISGIVQDSKTSDPLIGVTVMEKGTSNGVSTDVDGKFIIKAAPGGTLTFNYMGYKGREEKIGGRKDITITLDQKSQALDELVVIGYGVQKKSDITGSISSISGKDISSMPVASPLQALQGRAAGVNIIQNTGAPGSNTTIKIRGTGTINDSDPLYVVDGFIVDDITHLNSNDIANVEVFKDAASSAIYGARAANGVVSITTKSGTQGKTKVTFDTYVGVSSPWKTIKVMNAEQYGLMLDYMNDRKDYSVDGKLYYSKDANGNYYYDESKYFKLDTIMRNSPSSWWNAITQTGVKQQYNVSISGGSEKNKYMISTSYYDERGIVKTSNYSHFNTRMNMNNKLLPWLTLTTNLAYSFEDRKIVPEGSGSILKTALFQSPMVYTYNSRGYWYTSHPLAILARNHDRLKRHRIDMNLDLTANVCKYLTYQFKVSDFLIPEYSTNFYEVYALGTDFNIPTDLTTVYKRHNLTNKWEINNLLTFNWKNDVHNVTVLAGQTAEGYNYNYQESYRKGTASNSSDLWYLSAAYTGDKSYGRENDWTAVGFIGRINYDFKDRYLLQANMRADASSVFDKDERWGYFPSVSVGWKFSNEEFMKKFDWLSLGKVRVGWGKLGNNRIDELSRYTLIYTNYNYPYGPGQHVLYPGSTATTIGNEHIKWEKTETFNVGIDLGFFRNNLTLSAEYFNKKTTNMLLRVPTVISAGLDEAPMVNAGSVRNRGFEFNIDYKNHVGDFRYEAGFNISYIKNKVLSLGTGNEPVYGSYLSESSIVDYATRTEVGRPIGSFYGYVTDGIFQTYAEVRNSAQYEVGKDLTEQTTRPGDFRFKDLNGDGRITAEDRTYLGSPLPDFVFGIPIDLGYKNFDLSLFFQGQTGNKIFNVMDYYLYNAADGNCYADLLEKHWSGQLSSSRAFAALNTNTNIPDLDPNDAARNFRASDFFIKNGSYLRLKQVQLTYNFDKKLISKWKLEDLSVFISAYNLLTITGYDGFDPEVGKVVGTEGNNLNMGVDHGNYPQARTFTFGIKLSL